MKLTTAIAVGVKGIMFLAQVLLDRVFSTLPVQFIVFILFFYLGYHLTVREFFSTLVDMIIHVNECRNHYFEVIKAVGLLGFLVFAAVYLALLAFTTLGKEQKKLVVDNQQLLRLVADLKSQVVKGGQTIDDITCHSNQISNDYSQQSVELRTMSKRAEVAEDLLAQANCNMESYTDRIGSLTYYADVCKKHQQSLEDKLDNQDDLNAKLKRLNGMVKHYKRKAEEAERDCTENLMEFKEEKEALEKEVEALKVKVNSDSLKEVGDKKLEGLERKFKDLEEEATNLKATLESTKAGYEAEIEAMGTNMESLRAEVEGLSNTLETAKAAHDAEMKTMSSMRADLEREVKGVREELVLAQDELQGYTADEEERTEEIKKLKASKCAFQNEIKELKAAKGEQALEMKVLKTAKTAQGDQIISLKGTKASQEKAIQKLREQVEALKEKLNAPTTRYVQGPSLSNFGPPILPPS